MFSWSQDQEVGFIDFGSTFWWQACLAAAKACQGGVHYLTATQISLPLRRQHIGRARTVQWILVWGQRLGGPLRNAGSQNMTRWRRHDVDFVNHIMQVSHEIYKGV